MESAFANFSLSSLIDYDCPIYGNNSDYTIDQVIFWVEGVGLSAVATFGVLGNILSSVILSRQELRNSFNLLLIGLAFFDSCYIVGSLLETVRKSFRLATQTHLLLFPYLLYPGQMIAMTGSVFMIVAIAFERYVSVHHPLDYNQAMNDGSEIRKRLLKYFVPVVLLSVLINIPKFFETEAIFVPIEWDRNSSQVDDSSDLLSSSTLNGQDTALSEPQFEVRLNVTNMRIDPIYSSFVNWSQLVILGILPVCLLVYFNTKIYIDVKERERRRRPQSQRCVAAQARSELTAPASAVVTVRQQSNNQQASCSPTDRVSSEASDPNGDDLGRKYPIPPVGTNRPLGVSGLLAMTATRIQQKCCHRRSEATTFIVHVPKSFNDRGQNQPQVASRGDRPDPHRMSNARRRRVEDRMAILFMGIVTFFLLCHFPRILLNFYEMLVIEQAMACSKMGKRAFAVWAQIMTSVSHFLLVTNSSINILIYSLFNTQFRVAAKNLWRQVQLQFGCETRSKKMATLALPLHTTRRIKSVPVSPNGSFGMANEERNDKTTNGLASANLTAQNRLLAENLVTEVGIACSSEM